VKQKIQESESSKKLRASIVKSVPDRKTHRKSRQPNLYAIQLYTLIDRLSCGQIAAARDEGRHVRGATSHAVQAFKVPLTARCRGSAEGWLRREGEKGAPQAPNSRYRLRDRVEASHGGSSISGTRTSRIEIFRRVSQRIMPARNLSSQIKTRFRAVERTIAGGSFKK